MRYLATNGDWPACSPELVEQDLAWAVSWRFSPPARSLGGLIPRQHMYILNTGVAKGGGGGACTKGGRYWSRELGATLQLGREWGRERWGVGSCAPITRLRAGEGGEERRRCPVLKKYFGVMILRGQQTSPGYERMPQKVIMDATILPFTSFFFVAFVFYVSVVFLVFTFFFLLDYRCYYCPRVTILALSHPASLPGNRRHRRSSPSLVELCENIRRHTFHPENTPPRFARTGDNANLLVVPIEKNNARTWRCNPRHSCSQPAGGDHLIANVFAVFFKKWYSG